MVKAIEKTTGNEYTVKQIEGGYEVYEGDNLYKKLRESTFKKYFKTIKESKSEDNKVTENESTNNTEDFENSKQENKVEEKKENREVNKATEEVTEVSAEKRQQIIDKIKKLLALSQNNPSQEEAISAALMAQKLMAKYRIQEDETLDEITEEESIESIFSEQKHDSSLHAWRKSLAMIIAKNFCCKCYMSGSDVVFRGYKQDAEIALGAYTYLYTIGDRLGSKAYNESLRNTGSGRGVYNSFVMGFLKGVDEGLSVQCTALMLVVPKKVEEEYKQFSAGFRKGRAHQFSVTDSNQYNKGREEGKSAVKSRQLSGKGGK